MTFSIPSLSTFAASDTDYVTKLNIDNTALNTAFAGIQADITSVHNATGAALVADWERKGPSSESWPQGVLGAYSLVLDTSDLANDNISLTPTNASNVSCAIISGTRREHTGTLTGDVKTVGLADGSRTLYVGVNPSGDTDLVLVLSSSASTAALTLYEVALTVSGSNTAFALDGTPARTEKTLYWDNTVEQLRQETADITNWFITTQLNTITAALYTNYITVPHDFYIDNLNFGSNNISVSADFTVTLSGDTLSGTPTIITSAVSPSGTGFNETTVAPSAAYLNRAFPANTRLKFALSSISGSINNAFFNLYTRRAYNAPTFS